MTPPSPSGHPSPARPSLQWQIGAWFLVILAVTVIGLGVGIYGMVTRYVQRTALKRLQATALAGLARADHVDEEREPAEDDGRPDLELGAPIEARAAALVEAIGSRRFLARVARLDGTVLATSKDTVPRAPALDSQALARLRERSPLLAAAPLRQRVESYDEGEGIRRWQVMLLPLYRNGTLAGVLQVAQPARDQEMVKAVLQRYLLVGGTAALGLGVLAAILLARRLSAPLEQLEATARQVAEGDLDARVALRGGSREAHAVARAFNDMVARLQAALSAQRRFIADASHELKTPLTAIGGMAEMLRSGRSGDTPEARTRALDTIGREVDRMTALVCDLLALSQSEKGEGGPIEIVTLDARDLVDEAASRALTAQTARSGQNASTHAPLRVERANEALTVTGNRNRLVRAIGNLLDNAFAYTPPDGTVTVRERRDGHTVIIEVADTGPGLAPDDLSRVFERFYRADRSRSRGTGGSGLGLPIVRAIVEQHGGCVTLESTMGKGTVGRIELPARQP